jgi:WD40 repeat protein
MELDNRWGLWEIAVPDEYRTLSCGPGHHHAYLFPDVSADNRVLAAGSTPEAALWDLRDGKPLAFFQNPDGPNYVLLDLPATGPEAQLRSGHGGSLVTNGSTGLSRWPIEREDNDTLWRIGPPQRLSIPGTGQQLGQSKDGCVLATVNQQDGIVLHADRPDEPVHLGPHPRVLRVAVSPDGLWVATGGFGHPGGAKVWEARTGRLAKDLPVGVGCNVYFNPNGKHLLTIGDGVLRLWEVGSWNDVTWPQPLTGMAASFSADGRLLVVETGSGVARLLDAETGREYAGLEDPNQERAKFYCFSSDGTLLVTSGDGPAMHVWDLRLIRRHLAQMNLDWDLPPLPPSSPLSAGHPAPKVVVYQNWVERGLDHARQGQAEQALAAFRRAAADSAGALACVDGRSAEPADPMTWCDRACLLVQIGDLPGYRKLCRRMLERFGESTSSYDIGVLAYTCVLGPDALGDSRCALELAHQRETMTPAPSDYAIWSAQILGLAYYRTGAHDKAVDCLQTALADYPEWGHNVVNWLVLAMAHQRLGHTGESRQWLQKADNWIAATLRETPPEAGFVPPGWSWRDWLVVQFLHGEAESLVPGTDRDKPR